MPNCVLLMIREPSTNRCSRTAGKDADLASSSAMDLHHSNSRCSVGSSVFSETCHGTDIDLAAAHWNAFTNVATVAIWVRASICNIGAAWAYADGSFGAQSLNADSHPRNRSRAAHGAVHIAFCARPQSTRFWEAWNICPKVTARLLQ